MEQEDQSDFEAFDADAESEAAANVRSQQRARRAIIEAMKAQKANWQTDGMGLMGRGGSRFQFQGKSELGSERHLLRRADYNMDAGESVATADADPPSGP